MVSIQAAASFTKSVAWQNIDPTDLSLSLSCLSPRPDLGQAQASSAIHKDSQKSSRPNRLGPPATEGEGRDRSSSMTYFWQRRMKTSMRMKEWYHFFKIFNPSRCYQMPCAYYLDLFRVKVIRFHKSSGFLWY